MSTAANIEAAFNRAASLKPEIAAYNTGANGETIARYLINEFGLEGMESPSAWEISFLAVKDQLTPIPNFVMPLDQSTCDALNAMTGSEVRAKYQRDVEFRKLWDRFAQIKKPVSVGTADPYAGLTVAQYRAIPAAQNAKLYETDLRYRAAVDRLMAEGRI
jgi:hypothetical protein